MHGTQNADAIARLPTILFISSSVPMSRIVKNTKTLLTFMGICLFLSLLNPLFFLIDCYKFSK